MKRYALLTLTLAGAAAAALVLFVLSFDVNRYKGEIVAMVERYTAREFAIDGDLHLKLSWVPTVTASGVRLGNPPWAEAADLLTVERFEAQIALRPLIDGQLAIKRLALRRPVIALEKDADGSANWTFERRAPPAERAGAALALDLSRVEATDAAVLYRDAGMPAARRVEIASIVLAPAGPGRMQLALTASYAGNPLHVVGEIGDLRQFLADAAYPIALEGEAGEAHFVVAGQIERPQALQGLTLDLTLNAASLSDLGKLANQAWPAVGPVSLKTALALETDAYALTALAGTVGRSDFTGTARVATGTGRPMLSARLQAQRLDLREFLPAPARKTKDPARRLFSPEALPLAAVKAAAADAEVTLQAGALELPAIVLTNLNTAIKLVGGRLTFAPLTATLAGGRLAGNILLDTHGAAPRLTQSLQIVGLEPAALPWLATLVTGARSHVDLELRGVGPSFAAIMAGANGRLRVAVGPGRFTNRAAEGAKVGVLLRILQLVNPLAAHESHTEIECAAFNFPIAAGIARNDTGIALQTGTLNILGGGQIDLRTEQIDLGARARPRSGVSVNVGGFADFVRLGGTLAAPVPVADAKGTAVAGAKVGAALATGGLSLLVEGLYDRVTVDDGVCAVALGDKAVDAAQKPSAVEKATGVVRDAGSKAKALFKGLFDR